MKSTAVITPILLIIFLGYILRKKGIISKEGSENLTKIVFNVFIPILLFKNTAFSKLPDISIFGFVLTYYVAAVMTYLTGLLINRFFFKKNLRESSIFGLGSSYSNTVLIGVPFLLSAFGEIAMLPLFSIVTFQAATLFTMTTFLCESQGSNGFDIFRKTLIGFMKNPIIVSLFGGIIFNYFEIPLPEIILSSLNYLSEASLPSSLIVLGSILYDYSIKGHINRVFVMSSLKLVLFPAIVWLLFIMLNLNLDPFWIKIGIITAAFPTGINTYFFSKKYNSEREVLASSIMFSSLLSIFTLGLLLEIL
ncbi:MAG: AEC family transporter [Candidatus Delongbacteria bacterium]|nr:AEC family transporter [Candidatus Delongbacteria bacterium]MBN2835860.1 AEC family transporter [Candidatus Delongbacteria bacterium]